MTAQALPPSAAGLAAPLAGAPLDAAPADVAPADAAPANALAFYTLEEVAPGVVVAVAGGGGRAGANATIIDLGDRSVVVDAGLARSVGAALVEATREATGRAPAWLVYTHAHSDHIWGAAGFPETTEIVATRGAQQLILAAAGHEGDWYRATAPAELARIQRLLAGEQAPQRRAQLQAGLSFYTTALAELPTIQLRRPTLAFDRRITLHGSSRMLEVVTHGGGHTRSDACVWVPDVNLLVAGDLVTVDAHPWLPGGDPLEWLRILATLETLGAQTIVPGHGAVGDHAACAAVADYIRCILQLAEGAPLAPREEDADDLEDAYLAPSPEETRLWARSLPMPEAWSSWAFSSFFAHNLQHMATRLLEPASS